MKTWDEHHRDGFDAVGRDVTLLQQSLTTWDACRAMKHRETGERKGVTVAHIVEVREEALYRITYPIPKPYPGSSGRRTYRHEGDLTSAIQRVRKAVNR